MLMKLCICFGICLSSDRFCLRLTFFVNLELKMAQQNVFLSYVNETMYLLGNLSFFRSVCLRLRTDLTNQYVSLNKPVCFTHASVLLSSVNETMYLLGNLTFFKIHAKRFMSGMTHLVPMLSQNACCGCHSETSPFSNQQLTDRYITYC